MITRLKRAGVDIFKEAEKRNYHNKILKLPFVYVYERADSAVSLVGIQIFPEYIRQVLLEPAFQKYLTGKFSMQTIYDKNYNQKLQVNIELKKNIKTPKNLVKLVSKEIFKSLDKNSSEFHHLLSTSSEKHRRALQPNVLLYPYEDSKYFKVGIKQKWTIK
jgi:phenylacetate-CoA ligase